VEINEPVRIDFVVRALRSIYGTVTCKEFALESGKVYLHVDGSQSSIAVDQDGKYKAGDLSSGWHELTITYGPTQLTRRVELQPEPSNAGGIDFEVCGQDPSARMRSAPDLQKLLPIKLASGTGEKH
jgi:hypothetical protein